jgi:hypothetical protein
LKPSTTESNSRTTRVSRGGSFGGMTAAYLLRWPQVLDALAATQVGEVSEPVETEYGFHVFYRQSPPAKQTVSGSHIVIGHDQAEFLESLRGGDIFSRTREQGLALAEQVRARALEHPEQFDALVREFSEHLDVLVGGDLGEWSTWEATDYPMQREVLSQLPVGAVSAPLETLFGWEILLRSPHRERQVYAMTPVEVTFDTGVSATDTRSRASALERATELSLILQKQPERFDELQREGCCSYAVQWPDGRGWPPLMAVLKQLEPGQIAASPVDFGLSYIVPKRVLPTPAPQLDVKFDLPVPSAPDRNGRLDAVSDAPRLATGVSHP